jgi:hypothetical protein
MLSSSPSAPSDTLPSQDTSHCGGYCILHTGVPGQTPLPSLPLSSPTVSFTLAWFLGSHTGSTLSY